MIIIIDNIKKNCTKLSYLEIKFELFREYVDKTRIID